MRRLSVLSALAQLAGLALCLLLPASAMAARPVLADPTEAVVAPTGAGVRVHETVPVEREAGRSFLRLLVPADAQGLSVRVAGEQVARASAVTVPFAPQSALARELAAMAAEKAGCDGEVAVLDAWIAQAARDRDVGADFSGMYARRQEAAERAAGLEKALKARDGLPRTASLVRVDLLGTVSSVAVEVDYSYLLPGSGWSPYYRIDCQPGAGEGGEIHARLEARVRQNSGIDWKDTIVTLVSASRGGTTIPALREWLVGGDEPVAVVLGARMAAEGADAAAEASGPAAPRMARSAAVDTAGSYAAWAPAVRGLAHGETRVLLDSARWPARLAWTARPLDGDARVYLCVDQELADGCALWPAGRAELAVDGAYVGSAPFRPREGRVFLSFGADPRVELTASTEPRKSGKEGVIGQKRVWEWAWTYTLRNGRDEDVTVRVERPRPVSVDSDVAVEVVSDPPHGVDGGTLFWEVALPAGGSASVSHGVKVTAPETLNTHPVAP